MQNYTEEIAQIWKEEAQKELEKYNPLNEYCERVYFVRTNFLNRRTGKIKKRKKREVELLKFLPSGRCVAVKDSNTPGINELAEEIFSEINHDNSKNYVDLFLYYFKKM